MTLKENQMTYETTELDAIINNAKKTISSLLDSSPNYFGNDTGVKARVDSVLSDTKGTLGPHVEIATSSDIMRCVDLTILDKKATDAEVIEVAQRAAKEHCATVCVYPQHIPLVNKVMQENGVTDVPPIAVVGFPFVSDANATQSTIEETKNAISLGAKEIDMVLPINFREGGKDYVSHFNYIKSVVDAAHPIPVKVILETAYLSDDQIALASLISKIAGADWVKTSTGFADIDKFASGRTPEEKGATPRAVAIMRRAVGDTSLDNSGAVKPMGVKASGGVRNRDQALAVLNAGADRIGASGGINVELNNTNSIKPSSKY
jgi:deoxyribose-phosphate aldolase